MYFGVGVDERLQNMINGSDVAKDRNRSVVKKIRQAKEDRNLNRKFKAHCYKQESCIRDCVYIFCAHFIYLGV